MEPTKKTIQSSRSGPGCSFQDNNCEEHLRRRDDCQACWVLVPQVHDFIHRLPGEVQRIVITELTTSSAPCINYYFDRCNNHWNCKAGTHRPTRRVKVTPRRRYTSRCQLIHEEGYKAFFQKNVFLFESTRSPVIPWSISSQIVDPANFSNWFHSREYSCCENWDPVATRLLDFHLITEWKGHGSPKFINNGTYSYVDKYRYSIRHLVLKLTCSDFVQKEHATPNWAWALKVDCTY